jgi:hypothetical protein
MHTKFKILEIFINVQWENKIKFYSFDPHREKFSRSFHKLSLHENEAICLIMLCHLEVIIVRFTTIA